MAIDHPSLNRSIAPRLPLKQNKDPLIWHDGLVTGVRDQRVAALHVQRTAYSFQRMMTEFSFQQPATQRTWQRKASFAFSEKGPTGSVKCAFRVYESIQQNQNQNML